MCLPLGLCTDVSANLTSSIVEYLDCGNISEDDIMFGTTSTLALANGTFCSSTNDRVAVVDGSDGHFLRCDISAGHPAFDTCFSSTGSHSKTFWAYLAARSVYLWAKDSTFVLLDGTSLR